jgi:hypothetical protein
MPPEKVEIVMEAPTPIAVPPTKMPLIAEEIVPALLMPPPNEETASVPPRRNSLAC